MESRTATIMSEQTYLDGALECRERQREALTNVSSASAGNRAATAELHRAGLKRLEAFADRDDPAAIGRLDLEDGSTFYIGKQLINSDDRDLLVVNWKMDVAAPFYEATVANPLGAARKRTFNLQRHLLKEFEDLIFADLAERVEQLTDQQAWGVDDAVLRDLEQGRTGEMRDIVQTIHASQYPLIRTPLNRLLVVQGGPGTGKTVVALHRVSWLLYNYRETLQPADILVIGPSSTFTRYIQRVLPGLGDHEVAHGDLASLGPERSTGRYEDLGVAKLKGDSRMSGLLARGLSQRIRFPEREHEIMIGGPSSGVTITRATVEPQLADMAAQPYNAGRLRFRSWLSRRPSTRRNAAPLDATAVDATLERIWPSLTPAAFLRDLLGSRERLLAAAGDEFSAGDVQRLLRSAADRLRDEIWSHSDVALLDEVAFLLTGNSDSYKHIVVDEAQDLSPMQLRSIRRRSLDGSCTVVGDLAQSTGPWARDSWEDVVESLTQECEALEAALELGYRVPRQVFEFAAMLLPYAAPQIVAPRVIRDGPADPDLQHVDEDEVIETAVSHAQGHAGHGRFVGIICDDKARTPLEQVLRKRHVSYNDGSTFGNGKSINVLSAEESKGLEFDAIVVVEPADIAESGSVGLRRLYVALTRTTQFLSVCFSKPVVELGLLSSSAARRGGDVHSPDVLPQHQSPTVRTIHDPNPEVLEDRRRVAGPVQANRIVTSVARTMAVDIRGALSPETYPYLLIEIRKELGISIDHLLDLLAETED